VKFYLDTSVVASLYVPEKHTAEITQFLLENKQHYMCISRLVETEFYSVLAMKKRSKELSDSAVKGIADLFDYHLKMNSYEIIHVTDANFQNAINFLKSNKTNLRTLDAIHLASCDNISATMVTADKLLAKSANLLGVSCRLI
jgi:predicted nucleic acid-binding protein